MKLGELPENMRIRPDCPKSDPRDRFTSDFLHEELVLDGSAGSFLVEMDHKISTQEGITKGQLW